MLSFNLRFSSVQICVSVAGETGTIGTCAMSWSGPRQNTTSRLTKTFGPLSR
jgi:hypothetical protein